MGVTEGWVVTCLFAAKPIASTPACICTSALACLRGGLDRLISGRLRVHSLHWFGRRRLGLRLRSISTWFGSNWFGLRSVWKGTIYGEFVDCFLKYDANEYKDECRIQRVNDGRIQRVRDHFTRLSASARDRLTLLVDMADVLTRPSATNASTALWTLLCSHLTNTFVLCPGPCSRVYFPKFTVFFSPSQPTEPNVADAVWARIARSIISA